MSGSAPVGPPALAWPCCLLVAGVAVCVVSGLTGCTSGDATALADEAPVIEPYSQYDTVVAGDVTVLRITATDDRGLDRVRVEWGDGSPGVAVTVEGTQYRGVFRHVFSADGREVVRFTATDGSGQEALAIGIVQVLPRNDPPTVTVTHPDTAVVGVEIGAGLTVHDDRGLGVVTLDWGDGTRAWSYDFGTRCPSTCYRAMALQTGHVYERIGRYTLIVDAGDYDGAHTVEADTVEVIASALATRDRSRGP